MGTAEAVAVAVDQDKVAYGDGRLLEGSGLKMDQMRKGCKAHTVVDVVVGD